jgi:WD40-like Beta Propeller Repeat
MRRLALALLLAAPTLGRAQATTPNPTNLWLVPLRWRGDDLTVGEPVKLTGDRGLNSQPSFSPDGRSIVFSAVRDTGRDARSDIWRLDLESGGERQVTHTPENENSPTVNARGQYVAVRWVPATLFREFGPWVYDDAGRPLRAVLPMPDTTGYYTPLVDGRWALTRPKSRSFTIAVFSPRTGVITDVDSGVPALPAQRVPGTQSLSWVRIDSANGRHAIWLYELTTGRRSLLGPTLPGRTAHAWVPGRKALLMARGSTLYMRRTVGDTAWRPVATFADAGLRHATAYVVSPRGDRLIMTSPLRAPLAVVLRDSLEAGRPATEVAAMLGAWREAGRLGDYDLGEGALAALADERGQRGQRADAVVLHEAITALFPASHRALARLGDAQRAAGDTAAAVASWRRALTANPRATEEDRRAAEALERRIATP